MLLSMLFSSPFYIFARMVLFWVPTILIALTIHEFSHAAMAKVCGDDTADQMGRLSLNPLSHLDPLGTICLLIGFFGWGKPVPIDYRKLRNPKLGQILISLAGPISNILMAIFMGFLFQYGRAGVLKMANSGADLDLLPKTLAWFCLMYGSMGLLVNLMLAFFNLIPLYPLDGEKVLEGILPPMKAYKYSQYRRYGPPILLGMIMLGIAFDIPILYKILSFLVSPFIMWFGNLPMPDTMSEKVALFLGGKGINILLLYIDKFIQI